jgi:DNA polymerase (family X)
MLMDNEEIAKRLERHALIMEIREEDQFRIRSYRNAADVIQSWPTSMKRILREDGKKGLMSLPGIGRAISDKISELLETGTFEAWEKLTSETPESVLELLEVEGIGIKTAQTLYRNFKISSREDLLKFVEGGGLELVDGVGPKVAGRIRRALHLKAAGS